MFPQTNGLGDILVLRGGLLLCNILFVVIQKFIEDDIEKGIG